MLDIYDIVKRPLVTERAMNCLDTQNTYVFEVHPKANKVQIRNAVERLFEVKVLAVNTTRVVGKTRRFRTQVSRTPDGKKAYVKLREGDVIELF